MNKDIAQVKIAVPIKDLWKAMISDVTDIATKVVPDVMEKVEWIEGDGGLGSILLFKFCPYVKVSNQKEKVVEYDESLYQMTTTVVEGGALDRGFLSYTYGFKFTEVGEAETLIDVKVESEIKAQHTHVPGENLEPTLYYIKCLESYLLNGPF